MLPTIMRRTISAPKHVSGSWRVDEGRGSWSWHLTEDAAWEHIARLGTLGHRVPKR